MLDLPVQGTWLAGQAGASEFTNLHNTNTHRYAIDVLKLGPDGRLVHASELVVTNWYGHDERVYAPADGQVVKVVDGFNCGPIGNRDMVNRGGSHVVIDIGDDRQVLLAHVVTGSAAVEEGETVSSGALIGRVGNWGNSDAPHLHLHVQTELETEVRFRLRSMLRKRWLFWTAVVNGELIRNDWHMG